MISDLRPQPSSAAAPARPIVVQKFGGTSVGSVARIQRVAAHALAARKAGQDVVLVVSAMSGETNRLLGLAKDISEISDRRERDVLAAAGEQVSAALTAIAIKSLGGKAISFLGHQLPIRTDSAFGDARVRAVETEKLRAAFARGEIPVVAGFQGIDPDGNITTLGRGGSDTTAVAVAAALGSATCEIYTDVDGVYTADPNICAGARKLPRVSYSEMLDLASLGAKVLHDRCVELAREYAVPVHVRTSFSDVPGTWITPDDVGLGGISAIGVACDRHLAHVVLEPSATRAELTKILDSVRAKGVHIAGVFDEAEPYSFAVRAAEVAETRAALKGAKLPMKTIDDVARIAVVGSGLSSEHELTQRAKALISDHGIRPIRCQTTPTSFVVLVERTQADETMRALHDGLDVASASEMAAKQLAGTRYGREGLGE